MDDLPVPDRFSAYREVVSRLPVPVDVRTERPDGFWARMRATELGALAVVSLSTRSSAPYEVHRTPSLIRRSDPESYRLVLNVGGHSAFAHNRRDARLGPGDMALFDTSHPFHGWRGADPRTHHWVMVTFPYALLAMPPGAVRPLMGARLTGAEGIGALVAGFVSRLAEDADTYRPSDALHLSAGFLDLMAALISHELDTPAALPPESAHQVLLLQIQAFIQRRLGDPALTPELIAATHHISVRSLHRMFHTYGLTVSAWIRARRLERCRDDLADPLLAHRPIHAVAARWGFTSRTHFTHLFHAAYGMSPLEYRRRPTNDPSLTSTPTPLSTLNPLDPRHAR
jgi:AraC-like DNA-binding protein